MLIDENIMAANPNKNFNFIIALKGDLEIAGEINRRFPSENANLKIRTYKDSPRMQMVVKSVEINYRL